MIDTGCDIDGLFGKPLFPREVHKESRVSTSGHQGALGRDDNIWFRTSVWNGNTYSNLFIGTGENLIGLRFLARHLVTFDFPKRTMYLKQTSAGPLEGDILVEKTTAVIRAPAEFLESLKAKGQLPGLSKDHALFCVYHPRGDPNSYTFAFRENGDSATRHYKISRASKNAPWKLQKAWRTDQQDHTIEEYPVP